MKSLHKLLIVIVLILFSQTSILKAQYFNLGTDPRSIKWNQIETEQFTIVYPQENESQAKRLSIIMTKVYDYDGFSLKQKPPHIEILLHTRTAYSNGFVAWAPKRMELYTTPPQDNYGQDWMEQLAIHELRHAIQMQKVNNNFSKVLYYIFGEQITAVITGLYLPMWYLEGDATATETALSDFGRGRMPSFSQELRAQLLEKKRYSYDKAYMGSYRDFVPDHYVMGYHLVAKTREMFSQDVWERAHSNVAKNPLSIVPFNSGIKRKTKMNKTKLYRTAFDQLKQEWQAQYDRTTYTNFSEISKRGKYYQNYYFPKEVDNQHILSTVTGMDVAPHLALIDRTDNSSKTIAKLGYINYEDISYANGKAVWSEFQPHIRWENGGYSNLQLVDVQTGKKEQLTHKAKLFAPSISADAKQIVAVEVNPDASVNLVILDAQTGAEIEKIASPNNAFLQTPHWDNSGKTVVAIMQTSAGKKMVTYQTDTKTWSDITAPNAIDIRHPYMHDSTIYFAGSYSGIENIYRVNINSKAIEQVTSAPFGASAPSVSADGKKLYYNNYTSDGFMAVTAPISSLMSKPLEKVVQPINTMVEALSKNETGKPVFTNITQAEIDTVQTSRYHRANTNNLAKIHSWNPNLSLTQDYQLHFGVSVHSQNLLGSLAFSAGYRVDPQLTADEFFVRAEYRALWPVFAVEYTIKDLQYTSEWDGYQHIEDNRYVLYKTMDKTLVNTTDFTTSLPLNLSRGRWQRMLTPKIGYQYQFQPAFDYTYQYFQKVTVTDTSNGNATETIEYQPISEEFYLHSDKVDFQSLKYGISFANVARQSMRDVAPTWGNYISLLYQHTPWGNHNQGSVVAGQYFQFIPGLAKHHAIRIDLEAQQKVLGDEYYIAQGAIVDTLVYKSYDDVIAFARGYQNAEIVQPYQNIKMANIKLNYTLPLVNSDLSLGSIFYIKRFYTNLFYDNTFLESRIATDNFFYNGGNFTTTTSQNRYQSAGAQLFANFHFLRFKSYEFTFMLQGAYLFNTQTPSGGEISSDYAINAGLGMRF